MDLGNIADPYRAAAEGRHALELAKKQLIGNGEIREIQTFIECLNSPFKDWREVVNHPRFIHAYALIASQE